MSREKKLESGDGSGRLLDWFSARLNLTEIFSVLTSYGFYHGELDTRKPLREALAEVESRQVGSFGRWPRVLSLLIVVLLGVELCTGVLLALYYLPTPEAARASLGTILRDVEFGWLIHQVHYWGAQLLIAVCLLRLAIFFIRKAYGSPRELFWIFGALLLLVSFHADLTGRTLAMTVEAYWSAIRALEIADSVPVYGSFIMMLLGGDGTVIGELTLIRFYILHIAVLPLLALLLVYLHFSGVRRIGLMEIPGERKDTGKVAPRRHLYNLAIALAILFGVIGTLAVLFPNQFGAPADAYVTPSGVAPPWYFLAPFGFIEWVSSALPRFVAGAILLVFFLVFIAWPFFDRSSPGRSRALRFVVGVGVLVAWLAFTYYGARVA